MRLTVTVSCFASALSLAPGQQAKVANRRAVGAGLLGAIGRLPKKNRPNSCYPSLGAAVTTTPAAFAEAGSSPKFSFFGIFGNADTYSEGAAYGIDQSAPVYSPYSPYSSRDGKEEYKKGNAEEVAFKKKLFNESVKRVGFGLFVVILV